MSEAALAIEDGSVFIGQPFGATLDVAAEVVFNTGITGYQEVLSDPSYCGQAVVFTVPILGIYGVAPGRDDESEKPQATTIIYREASRIASNFAILLTCLLCPFGDSSCSMSHRGCWFSLRHLR